MTQFSNTAEDNGNQNNSIRDNDNGIQVHTQINEAILYAELDNLAYAMGADKHSIDNDIDNNIDNDIDNNVNLHFDIGIDEVGRGPLYGNVVIGAVILPKAWSYEVELLSERNKNAADTGLHGLVDLADTPLAHLTDSKKLSEKKRTALQPIIKQVAIGYVTVDIPAHIIDEINIYQATLLGMREASEAMIMALLTSLVKLQSDFQSLLQLKNGTRLSPIFTLLIDGNALPKFDWSAMFSRYQQEFIKDRIKANQFINFNINNSNNDDDDYKIIEAQTWIKGDARHTAIAAASVLAKVRRDNQLIQAGQDHPDYGLEKHKGYPTNIHIQALMQYGALPEHRRSFKPVQKAIDKKSPRNSDIV